MVAFRTEQHILSQPSFLISQLKRRHWLLAADEIGKPAMENWLAGVPAAWGSAGEGGLIDATPSANGWMCGGDCAEVTCADIHLPFVHLVVSS